MKKKPLIIIAGPTAVGKSKLAIKLAKEIGGEIISADSMQVYQYMDIGSAKVTKEEMEGVPHYLIDVLSPKESFDVVRFQTMAKEALQSIYQNNRIPIITGGTGFYIQALVYDIDFTENAEDLSYRKHLWEILNTKGEDALFAILQKVDEASSFVIHKNNHKRVIRALEFYHMTGEKISVHNEREREKESPYDFYYFVLNDEREKIYQNIDLRVDMMMKQGLLDEVKKLMDQGCERTDVSMQGLGYKEILDYLNGIITLEEAIYMIKRDTRHFAKRQLTWFRREKQIIWIHKNEFAYDDKEIIKYMKDKIR